MSFHFQCRLPTSALALLLAALVAPAGLADWLVQRLPMPPGREPQAALVVVAEPGAPGLELHTVELLGEGDEWYACGRGLGPGGVAAIHYTDANGRRQVVPLQGATQAGVARPHDVVLALDASLSMRVNDPADLRLAALRRFLALSRDSQTIRTFSLVVFRDDARIVLEGVPPATIGAEQEDAMVRQLRPRGGTSFDAPFAAIADLLGRLPAPANGGRAVLFLSDGEPIGRYRDGHRRLAAHDCSIYTIGLSEEADGTLLGRIAGEAGGLYFQAPTAAGLESIFVDIFRLIAFPEEVVRATLAPTGAASTQLIVDPSMRNPILALAPLNGDFEASVNGAPWPAPLAAGSLHSQPLPTATPGRHELTVRGTGRLSLRLQADTPHGLRTLALPLTAAAGTPLTLAAWLTEDAAVDDLDVSCQIRTPSGRLLPWKLRANPFGLFVGRWPDTGEVGGYEVEVVLTGRVQEWPLERRQVFAFRRTARLGPSLSAAGKFGVEMPLATPSPVAGADLPTALPRPEFATPGLEASLWTSVDELLIDLAPGGEATRTVDFQINGPQPSLSPTATLAWSPVAGLEVRVRSLPASGSRASLELTCVASSAAAGQAGQGSVQIVAGDLRRELSLVVRVSRPELRGELGPFAVARVDGHRLVRGHLRLRLEGAGECEVRIAATHAELAPLPRSTRLTSEGMDLPLELAVGAGGPLSWQGTITVDGPGLLPLQLPYAFELAAEPVAGQAASGRGWWLGLALLLLLLLLALLIAGLRGSRRAWFLLGSAAIHALILLAVLPRSRLREMADRLTGAIAIAEAPAVIEETVASEPGQHTPTEATPEPDAAAKTAAELAATAAANSRDLPPAEVEATPVEPPTAEAATPTAVDRPEIQPEELPTEQIVGPAKRIAAQPEASTQEAAKDPAASQPTPAEWQPTAAERPQELAAESATPAVPAPAADRQATPATPAPAQVELGDLPATPAAAGDRRQAETPAGAMAQPASPTAAGKAARDNTASSILDIRPADALDVDPATPATPTVPLPTTAAAPPVAAAPAAALPDLAATDESGEVAGKRSPPATAVAAVAAPLAAAAMPVNASVLELAPAAPGEDRRALAMPAVDAPPPAAPQAEPAPPGQPLAFRGDGVVDDPDSVASSLPVAAPGKRAGAAPDVRATGAVASSTLDKWVAAPRLPSGAVAGTRLAPAPPPPAASTPVALAGGGDRPATNWRPEGLPELAALLPAAPAPRGEWSPANAIPQPLAGQRQPSPSAGVGRLAPAVAPARRLEPSPAGGLPVEETSPNLPDGVIRIAGQDRSLPLPALPAASGLTTADRRMATGPQPGERPPIAQRPAAPQISPPPPPPPPLPAAPASALFPAAAPPLAVEPALQGHPRTEMLAEALGGLAGQWRRTFANLQHSGDWDCNRTAMLHLAHQFERRTGSVFPFSSRTVAAADPELSKAPFLFMSGHQPFAFDEGEAKRLADYLKQGGYLWINDSTDIGDDIFDTAVRQSLAKLFPGAELRPIPMDHPIFAGPYDLRNGFRGFQVPPGDKYRCDYLEGLWLDGRLAVVYTRNDYGDGLEIDIKTAPSMLSLTDLSALEMQEASIQMGINLATYFIFQGRPPKARLEGSLPPAPPSPLASLPEAPEPSPLLAEATAWKTPDGDSPDYLSVAALAAAPQPRVGLTIAFAAGGKPFLPWRSKAIVERRHEQLGIDGQSVLILDVDSRLAAGARLALAFGGDGPISYLETTAMFIRPGDNANLVFDLRQPMFKTEQSNWQIGVDFPADFRPHTLYLLVYPQGPDGTVECHNLRLARPGR